MRRHLITMLLALSWLIAGCGGEAPPATSTPPTTALAEAPTTAMPAVDAPTLAPTRTPQPPAPTAEPAASPYPMPPTPAPSRTPEPTATSEPTPPPDRTPLPEALTDWPYLTSLIVTPERPPALYAIIDGSPFRSVGGGQQWAAVSRAGLPEDAVATSVAIDYRNPSAMYLTTSRGLYRREGAEWALVHSLFARCLAVDLVNPGVLWAGVGYSTEYDGALVLKSEDGGRTWGTAGEGIVAGPQSWVAQILIDPQNPEVMYANVRSSGRFGWPTGGLYRGGRTGSWEWLTLGEESGPGACLANGIALDPNLRRLWVGCDAYHYNEHDLLFLRSDNAYAEDASTVAWERLRTLGREGEVYVGHVQVLAIDAQDPKGLYVLFSASTEADPGHRALVVSHDEAATWEALPPPAPPL